MQTRKNVKRLFGPEKLSELSRSGPPSRKVTETADGLCVI